MRALTLPIWMEIQSHTPILGSQIKGTAISGDTVPAANTSVEMSGPAPSQQRMVSPRQLRAHRKRFALPPGPVKLSNIAISWL